MRDHVPHKDETRQVGADLLETLNVAMEQAASLPASLDRDHAIGRIANAHKAAQGAIKAVIFEARVTFHADGSWKIEYGFNESGEPQLYTGDLTAADVVEEFSRMVHVADRQSAEPVAKEADPTHSLEEVSLADIPLDVPLSRLFAKEETDAEPVAGCNGPIGPDESHWLRVRALELAISAGGYHDTNALLANAKQIETFLKG